jgi:hypothetical protein
MKFCGCQARWQKRMPPRHKATDPYRRPLAHIMRTPITILLFLLTLNVSGQITAEERWASPIKNEFNLIKETGADTLLVYYEDLGPWTDLPDSCNSIPSAWIIWSKGNEYYAKKITCYQSTPSPCIMVSSMPINFIASHIKDLTNTKTDYKLELGYSTDATTEHLVFMTSKKQIRLNMSDYQRRDKNWRSLNWINATIQAIDTTKYELTNNNVR